MKNVSTEISANEELRRLLNLGFYTVNSPSIPGEILWFLIEVTAFDGKGITTLGQTSLPL